MAKLKLREFLLMSLPVIALSGVGAYLNSSSTTDQLVPTVDRVEVVPIRPDQPHGSHTKTDGRHYEDDTRVTVFVRYKAPSLYDYYTESVRVDSPIDWELLDSRFLDDKGRKVSDGFVWSWGELYHRKANLYGMSYEMAMDQIPKSVGRVTLKMKAQITDRNNQKWIVNTSCIVRQK